MHVAMACCLDILHSCHPPCCSSPVFIENPPFWLLVWKIIVYLYLSSSSCVSLSLFSSLFLHFSCNLWIVFVLLVLEEYDPGKQEWGESESWKELGHLGLHCNTCGYSPQHSRCMVITGMSPLQRFHNRRSFSEAEECICSQSSEWEWKCSLDTWYIPPKHAGRNKKTYGEYMWILCLTGQGSHASK